MKSNQHTDDVLNRFRTYPVMSRSMLSCNFVELSAIEIAKILDSLVEEGKLLRGALPGKRRGTVFFFLADEASRLEPFINAVKK